MAKRKQRSCGQKLCCIATVLLVLSTIGILSWYFIFFAKDVYDPIGYCGDCHCIPDNSTTTTCPTTDKPVTSYSEDMINVWKSQTIINPYRIDCNPYEDGNFCDTEPPLDTGLLALGEAAVCAIHYEQESARTISSESINGTIVSNNALICENIGYHLKTYPSWDDAVAAGGFVTHTGHCGVCSTLQDLAVYAEFLQQTSSGNFCRRQAVQSLENGIACYRNLGMTHDCARIWADTSWNTAKNCFTSCVLDPTLPQFGLPSLDGEGDEIDLNQTAAELATEESKSETNNNNVNNGPAPDCMLSECLLCDEEVSASIFERYAGRSRRRSGMLSTTAWPCSRLPSILQDPCPVTQPLE